MTPPFFLIDPAALAEVSDAACLTLEGAEGHHAVHVRRLTIGEPIVLADGFGNAAAGTVAEVNKASLVVAVEHRWSEPEPEPRITVVQALIKGDRMDQAVEQLTEVGVDAVVPWSATHSIVRWKGDTADNGVAKLQRRAQESAKQARRVRFPIVEPVASTDNVRDALAGYDLAIALDESAANSIVDVADTSVVDAGSVCLIVGPEGGISGDELEHFQAAGIRTARMGPTVMRAATASVSAATWLMGASGRWSNTGPNTANASMKDWADE